MSEKNEFLKDFYSSWVDFNLNMMKSTMDLSTETWKPENYEKFYGSWSKNMSEILEKTMRMPGFTTYSWEIFKSSTGFQKYLNDAMEQYHKTLKIPVHKDIDELSERINHLDDRIEELEKKLKESEKKKEKKSKE
jgi:predicted ribosome quality control (RQC) complex YloA/Tae2 family protein